MSKLFSEKPFHIFLLNLLNYHAICDAIFVVEKVPKICNFKKFFNLIILKRSTQFFFLYISDTNEHNKHKIAVSDNLNIFFKKKKAGLYNINLHQRILHNFFF